MNTPTSWAALRVYLASALKSVPASCAPDIIPFNYPGEEWKERAQLVDAEDAQWSETQDYISHFGRTGSWPLKTKPEACYFVGCRIEWSEKLTNLLSIPSTQSGQEFVPFPCKSLSEIIEWLLIDAYEQRNRPVTDVPMSFIGSDGKVKSFPQTK
jgi:hypothetical protein